MRKNPIVFWVAIVVWLSLGVSCKSVHPTANFGKTAIGKESMVVTAHPEATKVGVEILAQGGNAVDAMVAVHFALAVVYPSAGNLGGGGFMVLRDTLGGAYTLDFREKASLAAHKDMYLDEQGEVIPGLSLKGHKAAGVPGSVDGMIKAHGKFGNLPLGRLLDPAIRLAKRGFEITDQQASNFNQLRQQFITYNSDSLNIPLVKDKPWTTGDVLKQKDLTATLMRIKKDGRDGFYAGETARLIVEEMEAGNGIIDQEDLDRYEAVWREPVFGQYQGYKIISMGPPSSGGIALAQLLGMADHWDLAASGHNTIHTIHLMSEMERRVYADRATHLGDPDYWIVPQQQMLDPDYLLSRVAAINPAMATPSEEVRAMDLPDL